MNALVRDVMTPSVITVGKDTPLPHAANWDGLREQAAVAGRVVSPRAPSSL